LKSSFIVFMQNLLSVGTKVIPLLSTLIWSIVRVLFERFVTLLFCKISLVVLNCFRNLRFCRLFLPISLRWCVCFICVGFASLNLAVALFM